MHPNLKLGRLLLRVVLATLLFGCNHVREAARPPAAPSEAGGGPAASDVTFPALDDAADAADNAPIGRAAQQLSELIGTSPDSAGVRELMDQLGPATISRSDDSAYYSFKNHGLSLRFDSRDQLTSIFLYAEGADGYAQYQGELPRGLSFGLRRQAIEQLLGPPDRHAAGGAGVNSWADYPQQGLFISYDTESATDGTATMHHLVIIKADPAPLAGPLRSPFDQASDSSPSATVGDSNERALSQRSTSPGISREEARINASPSLLSFVEALRFGGPMRVVHQVVTGSRHSVGWAGGRRIGPVSREDMLDELGRVRLTDWQVFPPDCTTDQLYQWYRSRAEQVYGASLDVFRDRSLPRMHKWVTADGRPDALLAVWVKQELGGTPLRLGARPEPTETLYTPLLFCWSLDEVTASADAPRPDVIEQLEGRAADEEQVDRLYAVGNELVRQGRLPDAAVVYEQAVEKARQVFGPRDTKTAALTTNLAEIYRLTGRLTEAEPLLLEGLEIWKAARGADHPDVARALNNLAALYHTQGRYADAAPLYERSLAINEQALGAGHVHTVQTAFNLAELLRALHRFGPAERLYRRCRTARVYRSDYAKTAEAYRGLTVLLRQTGRYHEAAEEIETCLATVVPLLPADHPERLECLREAARVYLDQRRLNASKVAARKVLDTLDAAADPPADATAAALITMGEICRYLGQYREAEAALERGRALLEQAGLGQHPTMARLLAEASRLQEARGLKHEAIERMSESIAIRKLRWNQDGTVDLGEALNEFFRLANLLHLAGDYDEALRMYEGLQELIEQRLGDEHPFVAATLSAQASVHLKRHQLDRAKSLTEQAAGLAQKLFGADHFVMAAQYANLAYLAALEGRVDEAGDYFDRARRTSRRHSAELLPQMSREDQDALIVRKYAGELHVELSFALRHRERPELVRQSASWVLNGKGIAHEAAALATLRERELRDDGIRELVEGLSRARREIQMLGPATELDAAGRDELAKWQGHEEFLLSALRREGSALIEDSQWVRVEDLCGRLPQDSAYVDIVRLPVLSLAAPGNGPAAAEPARYVAWVALPAGQVQLVDLGSAEAIETHVHRLVDQLREAPHIPAVGHQASYEQVHRQLQPLAQLLLHPLLERIGSAQHLLISPDSDLWLVPWGALPLPDGRFAIERGPISYLVSGRDLIRRRQGEPQPTAVILADPNYDLPAAEVVARSERFLAGSTAELGEGPTPRNVAAGWPRLAGSAAEARLVQSSLTAWTHTQPDVYTGDDAVEAAFRAVRRPRLLLVSTHGFFQQKQDYAGLAQQQHGWTTRGIYIAPAAEDAPSQAATSEPFQNPLLRCGLVLAGANQLGGSGVLPEDPGRNLAGDGILTGLEILDTDLRGTEIVVLSACDTGVGDVRNGEGVAGLRQAFLLAGASTVLATLWQVPDRETSELTTGFFGELAAGSRQVDALHAAQLQLIRQLREQHGVAHPYFWAAFTLTGDPGGGGAAAR